MRHAALLPTVILAVVATSAGAQPTPGGAAQTRTSVGLVVETMTLPRQVDLPGRFNVAFRIQNSTTGPLVLREFVLRSVEAPTTLSVLKPCAGDGEQVSIPANDFHTVVCEVRSPGYGDSFLAFVTELLGRWSLLTLSAGDYQFVATASARGEDGQGNPTTVGTAKTLTVRLVPTVWQSVIGSMLGSALMVMFWLSSPVVRAHIGVASSRDGAAPGWWLDIGRASALWFGSTTAAAISIFLTFRLKDASLPFTLSVNDFYGGLVVGLFGVVLTNWLGPKLFGPPTPRE